MTGKQGELFQLDNDLAAIFETGELPPLDDDDFEE